jgi:hypothetical protein
VGGGHVLCMVEIRNACKMFIGKPERKRPLKRPWSRSEVNIKTDVG